MLRAIRFCTLILISSTLVSCSLSKCELDPCLSYTIPQRAVEHLQSPFPKLTATELALDWGRDLYIGKCFARQADYYRAITYFKTALFILPKNCSDRRYEIEYDIFMAYYMGGKYQDAVDTFELGHLAHAPQTFPAMKELMTALYDAYMKVDQPAKAIQILSMITESDPELAQNLNIGTSISNGDISCIIETSRGSAIEENIDAFVCNYGVQTKSVAKARALNAVLPGAGYYYVGQKKSAVTSFIINTLFIAASYQLYDRGYIPAAIILTSLEAGWYFGGINGAGLAANEYNRSIYENMGRDVMIDNRLFPVLMIQKAF